MINAHQQAAHKRSAERGRKVGLKRTRKSKRVKRKTSHQGAGSKNASKGRRGGTRKEQTGGVIRDHRDKAPRTPKEGMPQKGPRRPSGKERSKQSLHKNGYLVAAWTKVVGRVGGGGTFTEPGDRPLTRGGQKIKRRAPTYRPDRTEVTIHSRKIKSRPARGGDHNAQKKEGETQATLVTGKEKGLSHH